MTYTEINPEQLELYYLKFHSEKFTMKQAREDVSIFTYYMLGIKLFPYQDLFVNDRHKRLAVCSSRQIGKTTCISLMALHEALFFEKKQIVIISHTLDQSKKVLSGIRDLLYGGDRHMKTFSKNVGFFSTQVDESATNTTSQLSFKNGSVIRSLPATDAARGYSSDSVFIDEAGFVEDDVFSKILEPQVLFTGGRIILTTTPNGCQGFFFKLFDPDNTIPPNEKEYSCYWFPHWICDNENIKIMIQRKQATTDQLTFQQEYEAKFITSKSSFFEPPKIDAAMNNEVMQHFWKESDCWVGIDWGLKDCHTVITLSTRIGNKFKVLYQHEFPTGYDNRGVLDYIKSLSKDFKIKTIVTDDCGLAETQNRELEEQEWDIEIIRFDFKSEKISTYFGFKNWLDRGDVEMPNIPELAREMKALQLERSNTTGIIKIHKPQTGYDDRCDSLIMSFSPFNEDIASDFSESYLV